MLTFSEAPFSNFFVLIFSFFSVCVRIITTIHNQLGGVGIVRVALPTIHAGDLTESSPYTVDFRCNNTRYDNGFFLVLTKYVSS